MAMIHREQLQSTDADNIVAGMLMRRRGTNNHNWEASKGDQYPAPRGHSQLLGSMKISLIPPLLNTKSTPKTHNIAHHLENITTDQQKILKIIGIKHVEDEIEPGL